MRDGDRRLTVWRVARTHRPATGPRITLTGWHSIIKLGLSEDGGTGRHITGLKEGLTALLAGQRASRR